MEASLAFPLHFRSGARRRKTRFPRRVSARWPARSAVFAPDPSTMLRVMVRYSNHEAQTRRELTAEALSRNRWAGPAGLQIADLKLKNLQSALWSNLSVETTHRSRGYYSTGWCNALTEISRPQRAEYSTGSLRAKRALGAGPLRPKPAARRGERDVRPWAVCKVQLRLCNDVMPEVSVCLPSVAEYEFVFLARFGRVFVAMLRPRWTRVLDLPPLRKWRLFFNAVTVC